MKDCRRIVSFPYVSLDSLPSPELCVTIWVQSNAIRASPWPTSASHFLCTAHELYGLRWQHPPLRRGGGSLWKKLWLRILRKRPNHGSSELAQQQELVAGVS